MSLTFEQKAAAIEAWFAAMNARSIQQLCAMSDEAIEIMSMKPLLEPLLGTAFHGHAGLRTLMQWTFEHYPRIYVADISVRNTPVWTTVQSRWIYDVELAPQDSRLVWSLFEIEQTGIRRIRAYATEVEAHTAARRNSVLTPREREVFTLLARGLTATQIAEELSLSPLTVRTHIQNGKDRLRAKTRMEALSIAIKRGEISA
jgi:DNA-binding CsgD family transcriptional regulator